MTARPLTSRVLAQIVVLDVLLFATLFWRDPGEDGQSLVAHYIAFVAITDLTAIFLPTAKRHWFNVFRLISGLALLALTVTLALKGLDGRALGLTLASCALAGARVAHAGWLIRVSGPSLGELRAFPSRAERHVRDGTPSDRLGAGYLVIAALVLVFPQVFYWTHHNHGPQELDAVLVGLQASQALTVFLKMFVFETLIVEAGPKLGMRLVVAVLFAAQWPFMLDMYADAPLPYVHAIAEVFAAALVIAGYRVWRSASRSPDARLSPAR